ncbi:uncharacterized protein LOC114519565 [Dendronephthya gigantea]|uniref:uncharacterized protein LOC114519565 n=1 Tax=Dendronephthya gigantea TaxID=151771 RepID=UPI00106A8FAE|nr:uncharacterized protein LOC114519565 [Dendronephthya gigantea]
MGAGVSNPVLPASADFATSCVSLQHVNDITAVHLDKAGVNAMQTAIRETWRQGCVPVDPDCGCVTWLKLGGHSFVRANEETSVQLRQMICKIVEKLAAVGWKVAKTAQLGRKFEQSSFFLRKSAPDPPSLPYIGVGLSSNDGFVFINFPANLEQPIREVIQFTWRLGVQEWVYADGVLRVKLKGTPWKSSDEQAIQSKILIQEIIATLRCHQWSFVCNVNTKCTTDSLVFKFDPTIVPGEEVEFCTISLNRDDRLRLIKVKEDVVSRVRQVIQSAWGADKIQKEKDWFGSWEFKLAGILWHSTSDNSIKVRYLILKILEAMREKGWHSIAAIDMSRRGGTKSVLVFQKAQPRSDFISCLALADKDKFRLINMKPDMVELFKRTVLSRWGEGYESEKEKEFTFGNVWQMKLFCEPWHGGIRNDTLHAKSIICHVVEEFYKKGWRLYVCGDVSSEWIEKDDTVVEETGKNLQYPNDSHSLFFIFDPDNTGTPAAPTYAFNTQQYGMPGLPYPSAPPMRQPLYPPLPTEPPPPSYSQATGMNPEKN